ncbi:2-oxo-4-hydroxy-4-carboxy-5-ureidoimidazoline decarboxylase [Arthrobacter sp. NPDC097144]|uniref:2-oxo-4-hydroxy-4-carboxy-5-ureidoimidazoline decarboxylase n=1 Tax=Arthrobacter sp. NPDC097144 TaxID=3363946 RepID=UPI00380D3B80
MDLRTFNDSSPAAAAAALRPCLDIDRWVREIVDARPFTSAAELTAFAATAAPDWTAEEIDAALAHHPRIGERAAGSGIEARLSHREQSGVAVVPETSELLAARNAAYDQKFGRVFLIRAAGRSAEDILAALERRLTHSPQQELPIIAGELREIAVLRLKGMLTP